MFDYERYRDDNEIAVEWRFSSVKLKSAAGTSDAVKGRADAISTNLWARWRAPTGINFRQHPTRYVVEGSHSTFLGSQAGALGFNHLSSAGLGLELDASANVVCVYLTRALRGTLRVWTQYLGLFDWAGG